jgi:type IV secretion system protein VirB10
MADPEKTIPQIVDKRPKISGLLPKNAQTRVLAGVALAMILIMMFSGRKSAPTKAASNAGQIPSAMDPNAARIQEYRTHIEDEARQLALEEAQLVQTKQALGVRTPPSGPVESSTSKPAYATAPADAATPRENWIELDREKREYLGLYSSNIVLSHRVPDTAPVRGVEPDRAQASIDSATPSVAKPNPGAIQPTGAKPYRLFEGTFLETVLTNRLDSSFSGPVNCMVTTSVYGRDHQTLLIPQGTRALGEVRKLDAFGEQRLAVAFHRLIMPDGYSVNLDQFKGLDQIGETGLRDQVNHHYVQVFGVSLAIGAIAGLSQATTRYSLDESAADAYEQGVAGSLSQSSVHILDRYLNVLPTFTIREGHRIKIYLAQDLLLPAYSEHPATDF